MKYLYRTDDFMDYQFHAVVIDQYSETGSYTMIKRPGQGVELFQPLQ